MPYEPHVNLSQPEDNNAYVWRFIDLPKFLDLIRSGSLYFCRGDQFDDPYEGMPPDELRAFIDIDIDEPISWPFPQRPGPKGLRMKTDLQTLIVEVVISPSSPHYLLDSIKDIMSKYGYSVPVRISTANRLSYVD